MFNAKKKKLEELAILSQVLSAISYIPHQTTSEQSPTINVILKQIQAIVAEL